MKDIVFSIIMPCYNSQEYVKNAVESIIKQSYSKLELIIINDGSFDDTLEIVNSYAQKDKRIKIYSKDNGGYASAVNMGLDKVTGDYFCFIGSDDTFDTGLFQQIYNQICEIEFEPDCIAFRTLMFKNNQLPMRDDCTNFYTIAYAKETTIKQYSCDYPEHARIFSIKDTSKLFKTSLLKDLRYFGKYGIAADGIFSMLFSHKASSFLSIPYDGYLWNLRSDSVSSTNSIEKNIDQLNNWCKFYEELFKLDYNEITSVERTYSTIGLYIARDICSDIRNAFKYFQIIKNSSRFLLSIALKLVPSSISVGMRIVAASPILFSILYNIKNFLNPH